MNIYTVLLQVILVILLVPVLVLFVQVLCAYLPKRTVTVSDNPACKVAVLIPAHNEAAGITATIASVLPHMKAGDRVIVIADNCSDDTAKVAIAAGAEAIERHDDVKRGKGFALDFGVRYLEKNPPDVVLIIDADCIVAKGSLRVLASHAHALLKPVQSLYLMLTVPEAGLKSKIAEFAWLVKNQVRPLGFYRLGMPCPLMGSGMAFPWQQISRASLSSDNIVEDVKLGIDLATQGHKPVFYPDVLVTSYFPTSTEAQASQRKRWEHGHLTMILVETPRLLASALLKFDLGLIAMALDLIVPPIALLVMLLAGLTILLLLNYWLISTSLITLLVLAVGLVVFAVTILAAWWGWARNVIPFSGFLMAPVYVLAKIPHYLLYLVKRQKKWVRTNRD